MKKLILTIIIFIVLFLGCCIGINASLIDKYANEETQPPQSYVSEYIKDISKDNFEKIIKSINNNILLIEQEKENKEVKEESSPITEFSKTFEYWLNSISAYGSQSAIDAGGIVEYYPGYFASHDWSEGQTFLTFETGDIVHIGGYEVVIEGCIYTNSYIDTYENVRDRIGWDKICFQTCINDNGDVVIYYGSTSNNQSFYIEENNSVYIEEDNNFTYVETTSTDYAAIEAWNTKADALQQEAAAAGAEWAAAITEEPRNEERVAAASVWYDDVQARVMAHNANIPS